jgi:hypothetical protein
VCHWFIFSECSYVFGSMTVDNATVTCTADFPFTSFSGSTVTIGATGNSTFDRTNLKPASFAIQGVLSMDGYVTLTVNGDLTLDGAGVNMNVNAATAGQSNQVNVTGTLTCAHNSVISYFNYGTASNGAHDYTLFTWTSISGALTATDVSGQQWTFGLGGDNKSYHLTGNI